MKKGLYILIAALLLVTTVIGLNFNSPAAAQGPGEAPMLAEMVAAGELPPVEERLPANPLVIETSEEGIYGGTMTIADAQARLSLPHRATDHGLFGYNMDVSAYEPDVAASYEWNDDFTQLTLHLREGLKWSDGMPLTTADFQWFWDNVLYNEELRPNGPGGNFRLPSGDATMEIIDDYTLVYTWPVPNPGIMDAWGRSSFSSPGQGFWGPSHYWTQYHAEFVDRDELNQMALDNAYEATEDAEPWVAQFNGKHGQPYNGIRWDPAIPSIRAWNPVEIEQDYILMERNPYFYMVDAAGNQLPYFDYLRVDAVGDTELYNLKLSAGESDLGLWFPTFQSMELYRSGEEEGNYTTYIAQALEPCNPAVFFNQTVANAEKRELFRTFEFRAALSLAMDRDQMNDVLFFGLAVPHPSAPNKSMPWYSDDFWNEYVQNYDPDQANQMLDDLGLTDRDADGYRTLPGGDRLSLNIATSTGIGMYSQMCEMLTSDWKEIGVDMTCSLLDPTAHGDASETNEFELVIWNLGRGTLFGRGNPDNWAFLNNRSNYWAGSWSDWYITDGEEGEEPPDEIKAQNDLWFEYAQIASDSPEAATLGQEYYQFFADNLYFFCGPGTNPTPVIVRNDIGNFPPPGVTDLFMGSDNNFFHPYKIESWYRK